MQRAMYLVVLLASSGLLACGGGGGGGGGGKSDYELLSAVPAELDAKMADVMAPVDGVDAMIEKITGAPAKFNIPKEEMGKALTSALKGSPEMPGSLDEAGKAEFEGLLNEFAAYKGKLYGTPAAIRALGEHMAKQLVEVPVLATKAKTSLELKAKNPMSSKEEKADANKKLEGLNGIQEEVTKSIRLNIEKTKNLPAKATGSVAKFGNAMKELGVDMGASAAGGAKDAAKDATK
ncbi:hypothetical protein KKF91_05820 [Myxococcota bacterium]|nr:hypothetical protein [Myxococcota bacterium]MBU1430068.1 hypothetical protein [Myxococcota bacterium]MBU1896291.1 hypothetical protein [Myxococcota bacterium]